MPKITAGGGPTDVGAEPGQPGYVEPPVATVEPGPDPAEPPGEPQEPAEPAQEEEPSPGSSSSTSDGKPPQRPEPSEPVAGRPVPTTGSRSGRARTGGSTARSTGGDRQTGV